MPRNETPATRRVWSTFGLRLFLVLVLGIAGVIVSGTVGSTAPQPLQAGDPCLSPTTQLVTDAAGDQTGAPAANQQLDIRSVSIAEDYRTAGENRLVFTMKVTNLTTVPANGVWRIRFALGATTYYVAMEADANSVVTYKYGTQAGNLLTTGGTPEAGTFSADGTIVITIANSRVGGATAGQALTAINGATQTFVGVAGTGGFAGVDSTTPNATYTLVGKSAACAAATPTPTPTPSATPTPTPTPGGGGGTPGGPGYTVYNPPSGLGGSAGEPSIGINWKTGKVFFIASTQTLRITFDDCVSPSAAKWEDVSFPTTNRVTLDPILFTDSQTGRTFVNQLLGKAASMVYTDNDAGVDGKAVGDWIQSQGNGINSGVDHQTVGAGPFAAPLTRNPNSTVPYPNAVYYASQDAAVAQAAVSLDGGQTFGPAVPMYNLLQCTGIHGHLKVAPDGTAYVPNRSCTGTQGLVVSENNGASWTVRPVTGSTAAGALIDPSVGIGSNGTVYFGYVNGLGLPFAAVSPGTDPAKSKGKGWINNQRIGANLGIVNATFPQMIAGDGDRAALAFLGSTTAGDHQSPITATNPFKGKWHLYIATTYDGGATWTTVNATPNDPVQQGSICNSGTITCDRDPNDRNLLDFNDLQVDKQGRVLAAFADGCITTACINGDYTKNDYSARAAIARQSSGKGLFAAFDPNAPTAPKSPFVTATRDAAGVHLNWTVPEDGGSPITSYRVFRRSGAGAATQIAEVPATQLSYDDTTAAPGTTYFYHVRAVNAVGESAFCPGNEVVPGTVVDPCTVPGARVVSDPAGDTTPPPPIAPPSVDILSASVAEPFFGDGVNKLVFTLRVGTGAAPSNSQWYIIWSRPTPDANFDRNYVAMKTDPTGVISYEYGKVSPPSANLPTRVGDADSGTFDPATGTITITISNSKVDNVGAGQGLNGLDARTFFDRANGQPVTGLQATDTTSAGSYELVGNAACKPNAAPTAVLAASPTSGPAPLNVNFDGSASSDPDAGDTIVEYTFTFGDGSAAETRTVAAFASGAALTSHTYAAPGTYRATLTVKDSAGNTSLNVADKLITVNPGGCATNWALSSNGATASASSTATVRSYSPANAIDGDNTGVGWEQGGGWNDSTRDVYPDWLQVDFSGGKPVSEIRVYTLQNDFKSPRVPTPDMKANLYGLIDFDVQYWDGAAWLTVPGGAIRGNDLVMRTITFGQLTTQKIRVHVLNAREHFSRIVEVEAVGCAP